MISVFALINHQVRGAHHEPRAAMESLLYLQIHEPESAMRSSITKVDEQAKE
jgi:hypothetical protein